MPGGTSVPARRSLPATPVSQRERPLHHYSRTMEQERGKPRATLTADYQRDWPAYFATDTHPDATRRTLAGIDLEDMGRVMVCQLSMEETPEKGGEIIPRNLDLINASFALPFCRPDAFPPLWAFVADRLRRGGRFSGQFFGDRDEWQPVRPASHHTRAQVGTLLQQFAVEHMEEVEKEGDDAMGGAKHHHVFHVVARRL
ncbi:MAG: hypothetical protein K2Q09_06555 [Phycisphaerales bacterium]|nr:hypothetical protein [Phycisphaerales bacterium]